MPNVNGLGSVNALVSTWKIREHVRWVVLVESFSGCLCKRRFLQQLISHPIYAAPFIKHGKQISTGYIGNYIESYVISWWLIRRKAEEWIPKMGSLRLHWDGKRYHWIEHLASSVAASKQGWILNIEPNATEPCSLYIPGTFSSTLLLISSYKRGYPSKTMLNFRELRILKTIRRHSTCRIHDKFGYLLLQSSDT